MFGARIERRSKGRAERVREQALQCTNLVAAALALYAEVKQFASEWTLKRPPFRPPVKALKEILRSNLHDVGLAQTALSLTGTQLVVNRANDVLTACGKLAKLPTENPASTEWVSALEELSRTTFALKSSVRSDAGLPDLVAPDGE
jgi:hypothetical protein